MLFPPLLLCVSNFMIAQSHLPAHVTDTHQLLNEAQVSFIMFGISVLVGGLAPSQPIYLLVIVEMYTY